MQYMMEIDQQSGREGSHHLGGLGGQALGPSAPSNSQDLGDGLHKRTSMNKYYRIRIQGEDG